MESNGITTSGGSGTVGVFVNTYTHSLDAKKRLTVPSDWRELAGTPNKLFVLPGIKDQCLCVYPAHEMTRRLERIRNLSIADAKGRQFARVLASRSDLVPWDSQGRIRIKDELLEHAGIQSQVTMVGTFDGFELWNPELWTKENASVDNDGLSEAIQYVGF
jgi:MraZ protein